MSTHNQQQGVSPLDRVEERRLIDQARAGDADAFSALYRVNVQAIYRYIYHRVSDTQLAEDLTGDVFIRALKGIGTYTDQGRPLVAWLYRIAHARVVDHYRKTDRRPVETDVSVEPLSITPNMDGDLVRKHAAKTLQVAIATLTEEQQQVIIYRFIEGYRIDRVAELMGKKPNAIKALQHRALRSLARHLERSGFDVSTIMADLS